MRDFDGRCWTQNMAWGTKNTSGPATDPKSLGLEVLESIPGDALCTEPGKICTGMTGNSGFQAINLAYHLGADLIVLLGYDMTGSGHFFGMHPREINTHRAPADRFIDSYRCLKDAPVTILNASRHTAIKTLPRIKLEDVW